MSASVHYHLGKFPPASLDWARLIPLIGPASAGLERIRAKRAAQKTAKTAHRHRSRELV